MSAAYKEPRPSTGASGTTGPTILNGRWFSISGNNTNVTRTRSRRITTQRYQKGCGESSPDWSDRGQILQGR